MATEYKILVGSKDEKARNSVTGRKQAAILKEWNKGGGQLSTTQIAENATAALDDDEMKVTGAEVSKFIKEFKVTFAKQAKQLPTIKAGRKGKGAMASANEEEVDSFLADLLA